MAAIEAEARHPDHADYGLFILVVMSHGAQNDCIYGTDLEVIKVKDICDRLSLHHFPHMAGKPKVVIIQACAGGEGLDQERYLLRCSVFCGTKKVTK